ncbi:CoA-binding domain protein [Magnetococcus marinus MC-1]|uniref:CoA-binding domain protein n=1 Tax=Magnetococcus marinus (strain ATCC BAA-1437 / JCM 17883 / MC-1) TaxID=156889 RepID=A0LCY4_MAGMM|nr:CoA-binding protein [Magnetococcus marinus]ABK45827.1 CoA-binding domain protein [Magnetococcus marinus MC-1]
MSLMNDDQMVEMLKVSKTIAVVGLSPKPDRASNRVAAYMQRQGYTIIPVHPGVDQVLGEKAYATLEDIPSHIQVDIVDVFRRAEQTPEVCQAAVNIGAKYVWIQLGIANADSMAICAAAGIPATQDLCLKIEHARLQHQL